jgi:ABC-2 type transport system permease protein
MSAMIAVVRRELLVFSRYPTWILSMVIWPVLFPLIYLLGSRALTGPGGEGLPAFVRAAGTDNVRGFIVIGTTAWMWLNITLWSVGTSLRNDQVRGTLEGNWLTPTPRFALLLGTAASQALLSVLFLVVSFANFALLLGIRFEADLLGALAILAASVPWIYGLSIAFAALVLRFKEANAMVYIVRGVFMVFAGISFPLSVLPGWMRAAAAYLPLTHTIEGARAALLTGAGFSELRASLTFLIWSGVVLLALGYVSFQAVDRIVRRQGSVGHY